MVIRLGYQMGKRVSNKGFTLLEMLLVLSVLAMCLLVFPLIKVPVGVAFRYQIQEIQMKLLAAQQTAICEKRDVFVDFLGNVVQIDKLVIKLPKNTHCDIRKLHFTPVGNVSGANTITCTRGKAKKQLVIQVGTGRMHVK